MSADADCIHFLTVPPSREMAEASLLPELRVWFASAYGEPTPVQRHAWPAIRAGSHLLLSSPTGSGKTLAAFLPILSNLGSAASSGLQCLYVAPLKALVRDVRANLKRTWRDIQGAGFLQDVDVRIGIRTGDTSQRVRRRQLSEPPAILLTTPESLAQMLANAEYRELFRSLRWIIVDEIHALAGTKRGADLTLSLERLAGMHVHSDGPVTSGPQRIGLSATCAPLAAVARFLVGAGRSCAVARIQDATEKHLIVEPLFTKGEYNPGWLGTLVDRLDSELAAQRTTLIFTNTRNLAERLTWALRRRYPGRSAEIAVHHSSLSAARRRVVERHLKQGLLWAVVSSSSLELGIDIGTADGVVFVHPPGAVARLLQRVGRSGHRPGEPRRGLLLTASAGELLEAAVTAGSGRAGQIESVAMLDEPLDVLCQHIAGMAMSGPWAAEDAYDLVRRAAPYRNLLRSDFQDCLDYLSGRMRDGTTWLPSRLRWHEDCFTIADARTAKLLRRNLGSILTEDACAIRLRVSVEKNEEPATQMLGELDALYAERLQPGDRFVLDGRCLEMKERESSALLVDEVFGRPQIPRWLGASLPMPVALARRIYLFRVQAAEALRGPDEAFDFFLRRDFHLQDAAIAGLRDYLLMQEAVSEVPSLTTLLIECVTMQACQEYYLHTPLPKSANEVLARVLLQRWRHARRPPAMALAADLGIYVLAQGGEPIGPDEWRAWLGPARFAEDFQTQLDGSDTVRDHFARVAQTGLMVLRHPAGRKTKVGGKDWTARRLYDQVRARAADFVLLRQTDKEMKDGIFDLATAQAFAETLSALTIRLRSLAAPSPLGEGLVRFGAQASTITSDAELAGAETV